MAEMVASPQTYREGREEYPNEANYDGDVRYLIISLEPKVRC